MRLQFGKEEWLHVLMAMRIAQKVLAHGEHKTSAWDTARGRFIIGQLMALVKQGGTQPQVATKIDLGHLMGMLPDDTDAPIVATAHTPAEEPDDPGPRLAALEKQVISLMQQQAQAPAAPAAPAAEGMDEQVAQLREFINQQNSSIFDFLAQLEDRMRALEAKRGKNAKA